MKMYKYFLPILATTLVVGTSAPAWSSPIQKIQHVGQSVSRFFQKSDDAVGLFGRKQTKNILTEIGKEFLHNTLPPRISPPESINLDHFPSNGKTQDNVRQNIDRTGRAVVAGTTVAGIGDSYVSSNNKDNQNPRSTIQLIPSLLSKKSLKLK